jgi:tetratricopeptide (TPR) repeat protein
MSPRPQPQRRSEFEPALELARQRRYADAARAIEQALETTASADGIAGAAANAYAEVARLAERDRDLAVAEQALERAVALRPRFPDHQYRLGCVLLRRGRTLEARRAIERALAVNPKYAAAKVELALLDARDGMVGEAVDALRTLGRDARLSDPRAFQQGVRSLESGHGEEATALLHRALHGGGEELRERFETYHERMRRDDAEGAAESLRELLPEHDEYPDVHCLIGIAELRLGHADDALASLARALELHPDFHEARLQFAWALEAVGQHAEALEQANAILRADPEHAEAHRFVQARERRAGLKRAA